MTIRIATFQDIPELKKLLDDSVRSLSKDYYTTSQIDSALKYIFGIDSQLIDDGSYYVVELDGTIAGCGGWSRRKTLYGGDQHKELYDTLLDPTREPARIRAFFVHPDYARRGIGRKIIELCENEAKKHGFSSLALGATLPGVPLYKAMGFKEMEQIVEPLSDGEKLELVSMIKNI
ncbi:GNAT family N-acetyltransferase [uncultured Pedobacter sp.]|uniref:GNAT family N-acetyltransferase n=1 Tax=uncultured Pedobacter sp. TaxID=246139 RepID=UPI0025D39405|nr:GNAT family N-acetyltransferase [uncultured Pedobacter sp.]